MIRFIIGKQFTDDVVYLIGASSGFYEVDDKIDFENFPLNKGMVKMKLPDNFNVTKFEAQEYDSEFHEYKSGVDVTGSSIPLDIPFDDLVVNEEGYAVVDDDGKPKVERKVIRQKLLENKYRKVKLTKTGYDTIETEDLE